MTTARIYMHQSYTDDRRRPHFTHEIWAGIVAGQLSGLAMAVALMAMLGVFLGESIFYPLQVIAASALGEQAIGRLDVRTIATGIVLHQLGPALFWGVVFGAVVWIFKPRRSLALMMWGLLVGVIAQVVDVYVVLPLLTGQLSGRLPILLPLQHEDFWTRVPTVASWVAHLIFGLGLSLYPWKYDPIVHSFD